VAVLCAVVQSADSFEEHVLHVRKLRDLDFCRWLAAQLAVTILGRNGKNAAHFLRSTWRQPCRTAFAADVEFGTVLADRTLQRVRTATQRD
jgi:hypothetical protein